MSKKTQECVCSDTKKVAFAVRRIDHLPYFKVLLQELNNQKFEIDLFIDAKYMSQIKTNEDKIDLKNLGINNIMGINRDISFISFTKKLLGLLSYLTDPDFEKEYFIRYANRTKVECNLNWLIKSKERAPRLTSKIAKVLVVILRRFVIVYARITFCVNKEFKYDLLIVSPGNMIDSVEDSLLICARIKKVRSIVLALSLDNLNNKGTIIHVPDIYLAWNSHHKRLLRERHLIPENRIRTCGSPYFEMYANLDEINTSASVSSLFSNAKPSRTILYLGSSANVISREDIFLSQLIENSGILDRGYEIIIRPHPANSSIWKNWDLSGTIIFPKDSQLLERDALTTREIMKNVEFCVGVNTSAFLDSIACGIPTFAMRNPNALFQKNASHFNFLLKAGLPIVNSFTEVLYNKKYLDKNVSDNQLIREIVLPYFGKVGKRFAEICNEVLVSEGVHNHGRY